MGKFFDLDSPLMQGLNKMADLMILNLITLVCCLPVITAGAALTGLHFVALKIVRNEETYIIKTFFRSFKQNFKQATILWILKLLIAAFLVVDFKIAIDMAESLPFWVVIGLFAVTIIVFALGLHVFPLLSKFENPIKNTIKNSVLVGLLIFPKTLLMVVCWAVPVLIMLSLEIAWPLVILFGFSAPAFISALLYNKTFKKLEPPEEEKDADAWTLEVEEETL